MFKKIKIRTDMHETKHPQKTDKKKDDAEKPDYLKKEIYCCYYYQIDFKSTEAYKNTTYNETMTVITFKVLT